MLNKLYHWLRGHTSCTVVLADGRLYDGWVLSVLYSSGSVVVEWVSSSNPVEFQLADIKSLLVAPR
jgi:hypothetical protein